MKKSFILVAICLCISSSVAQTENLTLARSVEDLIARLTGQTAVFTTTINTSQNPGAMNANNETGGIVRRAGIDI